MASENRVEQYKRLNDKYLLDADELLRKGDFSHASEKFWGAAAEIVKAYAAKRGRRTKTHTDLWEIVEELDQGHPELGLLRDFYDASHLHSNFYEDELRPSAVRLGARVVKDFVKKMERFIK